jgi:hypothetical protein
MEKTSDKRTFIVSSELFSDFQTDISLYNIETLDDIITIFKKTLVDLFVDNKLNNLAEIVKNKNFHIHSYTIEEILVSSHESYFYICDHC